VDHRVPVDLISWPARLGLWGGLIGFFLLRSSSDAYHSARRREQLGRRRVRDLMGTVPPTVPAGLQLSDVVVRLQTRPSVLWPVGRPLIGGVTLEDVTGVPSSEWGAVTVDAVVEQDVFVADDTPMDEAVDLLVRARDRMLIAVRDGEPVGLLTPSLVADTTT
jgi:CBS domain-containing protein